MWWESFKDSSPCSLPPAIYVFCVTSLLKCGLAQMALLLREYDRNDGYHFHVYAIEECDLYLTGLFPLFS